MNFVDECVAAVGIVNAVFSSDADSIVGISARSAIVDNAVASVGTDACVDCCDTVGCLRGCTRGV